MGSMESVQSIQSKHSLSSRSSSADFNIQNFNKIGLEVKIENLSESDGKDILKMVMRLRVPFFDNSTLQTLSNITYLTGNGPFHEGLIFESRKGLYYIAQTYPVTFMSVNSLNQAVREIVSFCQFNQKSHEFKVTNSYCPTNLVTIEEIASIIRSMPNEYNILGENCQKFCQKIITNLKLRAI